MISGSTPFAADIILRECVEYNDGGGGWGGVVYTGFEINVYFFST